MDSQESKQKYFQSESDQFNIELVELHKLLYRTLSYSQRIFQTQQQLKQLYNKIQQYNPNEKDIIKVFQWILLKLISKMEVLKGQINIRDSARNYQNLQKNVQKCQSDIRKHIRVSYFYQVQQQMKIYCENLEQKIEILESKLHEEKLEKNKVKYEKQILKKQIQSLKISLKNFEDACFKPDIKNQITEKKKKESIRKQIPKVMQQKVNSNFLQHKQQDNRKTNILNRKRKSQFICNTSAGEDDPISQSKLKMYLNKPKNSMKKIDQTGTTTYNSKNKNNRRKLLNKQRCFSMCK